MFSLWFSQNYELAKRPTTEENATNSGWGLLTLTEGTDLVFIDIQVPATIMYQVILRYEVSWTLNLLHVNNYIDDLKLYMYLMQSLNAVLITNVNKPYKNKCFNISFGPKKY